MSRLIIVPIFAYMVCMGCSIKNESPLSKDFKGALSQVNPNERINDCKAFLVIPNTGCTGCISSAESLLLENYKTTKKIKFILTRIESYKNLYLKLKIDIKNEPNILIDSNNVFSRKPFASIYPQVFFVDTLTGEIISKEEISPSGKALEEIAKRIF